MVSGVAARNRPYSTAASVTIAGLNFAPVDATPTAQAGLNACGTAAWASGTSVLCMQTLGATPADVSAVVTVDSIYIGTQQIAFTFDGIPHLLCLWSAGA